MSPTFFSDIYIGITATITATLPPKQYLHRHLHRQNSSNLQRSQTNCKLITFPKLSQKKEEEGDHRKNKFTPYYIKIAPRPYKTYSQGARVQRFCILIKHSNKQQTFS